MPEPDPASGSSSEPSVVQGQWNVLETALLAKDTLLTILRACAEEDVQGQAVLAFEGLGFGLMVDEERREQGQKALRTFTSRVVHQLRLSIGLSKGGLAMQMSKSSNLIASFLLICALKVCFKDENTAAVLYEMMKRKGVHQRVPVLPWQVAQVVSAVSGYSANLEGELPSHVFEKVLQLVQAKCAARGTGQNVDYIKACPTGMLCRVLTDVFLGLQDAEAKQITIEGGLGGIWITSFFCWLCPSMTEFFVHGEPMAQNPHARILIYLKPIGTWEIQVWRSEEEPSKVLVLNDQLQVRGENPPFDYYPLHAAKQIIGSMSPQMDASVMESIGLLAGALVDVAVSEGRLCSREYAPSCTLAQSVRLLDICSRNFLNTYPRTMERFGWTCDNMYHEKKAELRGALQSQFDSRDPSYVDPEEDCLKVMKTAICDCCARFADANRERILPVSENVLDKLVIDPAIHLAGEALLKCLSNGDFCGSFRPMEWVQLKQNFELMRRMVFGSRFPSPYSYSKFRSEAIRACMLGSPEVSFVDLAIVSDGYVAYSSILDTVGSKNSSAAQMTDPRLVSEIKVVPGALRMTDGRGNPSTLEPGQFSKLVEKTFTTESPAFAGPIIALHLPPVTCFDKNGAYGGFQEQRNPSGIQVNHLVTPSHSRERALWLSTQLRPESRGTFELALPTHPLLGDLSASLNPPIAVSWADSMRAVAFARHVTDYNVLPEQMQRLVRLWRDCGYLGENNLVWAQAGHTVHDGSVHGGDSRRRYVTMTSTDEQLRFFEAGRLGRTLPLYVRHKTTLEQCLMEAFANLDEFPVWAVIA